MEQQLSNKSYSLTKAQKRVWFQAKSADKPLPNIAMVFELQGNLNVPALRKAIEILVDENSVLKSTIYSSTDHLERVINPAINGVIELVDLTQDTKQTDIYWLLQNIADINFNLATGPLFQFHLIKQNHDHYYFTIMIHPIIIDRYSLKHLVSEISRHYNNIACEQTENVHDELFDFNKIVELEKIFYTTEKCRNGLTHWSNTLKANQFYLDLPPQGYFTKEYIDSPFFEILLNTDISKKVKIYAEKNKIDYTIVLMAAYQALLKRYSNNNNIIINYSSAVSYTNKKVFGCLENRIPLRVLLHEGISFNELVKLTNKQLSYDNFYKDVQITDIVKSIRDKYDYHFSGAFTNTSFDFNYLPYDELKLGDVNVKLIPKFMKKFVTEDLAIYYRDMGESISLIADFDEKLDSTAVKNFMHHYEILLEECLLSPDQPIAKHPILTRDEYEQIIGEWNKTETNYPNQLMYRLFEEQVEKTPEKIALVYDNQTLTYRELNDKANQLAHAISKQLTAEDHFVGICLSRGLDMIISMYAIYKTGTAYVPLDPQYPEERLNYILSDTKIKIIISNNELTNTLGFLKADNRHIINVEKDADIIAAESKENLNIDAKITDLAYVIYTSGSTGLPKGVMIEQRNLTNLCFAYKDYFLVDTNSRVLQFASMNFDAAVPEVFSSLSQGATVYVVNEEVRQSSELLIDFIEQNAITSVFLTPALLKILPRRALPALQVLSFGGDVCNQETADYWSKGRRFINGYGPTEVTVFSTFSILKPGDPVNRIGKPLPNYTAYVLDENLNPVPIGMSGELYMGGVGVGRGYINRPELTAERYIPNPFRSNDTLYKTGDLVRYLPDGNILYIGRTDFEVKIRGFRINLNDIELVLRAHPAIKNVTTKVWQKPDLDKFITVYYVTHPGAVTDTQDLKNHILKKMPEYMVPAYFVELDEIPISINGKINQALLPDPIQHSLAGDQAANREEEAIIEIWAKLLRIPENIIHSNSDFFELGGHSLLATQLVSRVKSKLNVDVSVKQVFQNSLLKQFAKLIRDAGLLQAKKFALVKAENQEKYPLSFAQQRLWYFAKTMPDSMFYNILFSIQFSSSVNITLLRRALINLFNEHAIFRTIFIEEHGVAYQKVLPKAECDITLIDCMSDEDIESQLEEERNHTFNLEKLPLFRCKLLLLANGEITFIFNVHHIIFDGWSLDVLMRDLGKHYSALVRGQTILPTPIAISYTDFSCSQKTWHEEGQFTEQLHYWQQKLNGELPVLEMPTDFKRNNERAFQGDIVKISLPNNLVNLAKKTALTNKVSLYSLLLSAYYVFLYRITGQQDIIVGSPIANRTREELETLIGFFVNTIVQRVQFSGSMSFEELLLQVQEEVVAAQDNQDVPFDLLVNNLSIERDTSRNPVFQTMFALQNGFSLSGAWSEGEVNYKIHEMHTRTSKFDISLILNDNSHRDQIFGYFEFDTELFRKDTIEKFTEHYINILQSVLENTQKVIDTIPLLSFEEYQNIIFDWNKTQRPYPLKLMHKIFEEQVEKTPDNIALIHLDEKYTFRELNNISNQLAHYIQKKYLATTHKELQPDTFIGLCVERGANLIISVLAILKSGGAFVSLDPDYPRERLSYFLEDTQCKLVVTQKSLLDNLEFLAHDNRCVIQVPEEWKTFTTESTNNPHSITSTDNLAYVIYTSGSTGKPKGVMIEHRSVPNMVMGYMDQFNIDANSRVLLYASINFDAVIPEIFMPLYCGGTMYIAPSDLRHSPEGLLDYIEQNAISWALLPPALLRLLPKRKVPSLKMLAFGGDACDQDTSDFWAKNTIFVNAYGPTETTVAACYSILKPGDPVNRIGKPLQNYKMYVLDKNLNPLPIGVPGELHIGGACLARGYLNREDFTIERFIVNPFSDDPMEKIYRTGDAVRWLPDGNLEYIGRTDLQVKIRGFRIEIGEIEAVLNHCNGVKEGIVIVDGQGHEKRLLAYYTQEPNTNLTITDIRQFMLTKLPDYMIPAAFVKINKIPIAASGKIDKKALPKLEDDMVVRLDEYLELSDGIERELAEIWTDLLVSKNSRVTVHANSDFFAMGGHSLLAIQLVSRIKTAFNVNISVKNIFQNSSIKLLAKFLREHEGVHEEPLVLEKAPQNTLYPLSFAQQRLWFFYKSMPNGIFYNILFSIRFEKEINSTLLQKAISNVLNEHEIFRTEFFEENGEALQRVLDHIDFDISIINCKTNQDAEQELENEKFHVFDLIKPPYVKCTILLTPNNKTTLLFNVHHIIFDGWSLDIFMTELAKHYHALINNTIATKYAPDITYKDFAYCQNIWRNQGKFKDQLAFWQKKLADDLPILELPLDFKRKKEREYLGEIVEIHFPKQSIHKLKQLSINNKISLNSVLLTVYYVFLYKITKQNDIIVGIPAANRVHRELENLIGFFVNTIAERIKISGQNSFIELMQYVNHEIICSQENQDVPFDLLLDKLKIERDSSRNPIFQTMFVMQNGSALENSLSGSNIDYKIRGEHAHVAKFDLTLLLNDNSQKDNISGYFEYDTSLFRKESIERFAKIYLTIIDEIINNPGIMLDNISILSAEDFHTIIHTWNQTEADYPKVTAVTAFENQAIKTPNNIAVVYKNEKITYAELNNQANQLARYLRRKYSAVTHNEISSDTFIGLCMPRGIDLIVGILGILKAGAAYVALDPEYPRDRLSYVLEDTECKIILTEQSELNKVEFLTDNNRHAICFTNERDNIKNFASDNLNIDIKTNDLAYIIYTSGSTGLPKGVMIEHKGIPNLATAYQKRFYISEKSRVLQYASINFDAAIPEIFTPLLCGATTYILENELRQSLDELLDYIDKNAITTAVLPPALLRVLPHRHLEKLETLAFGGDTCDQETINYWSAGRNFINAYGPTEVTVCATCSQLIPGDPANRIGKPLQNYKVYILDNNLNPLPIGIPGELFIGGMALARGYLKRPDLTAERFISNPFSNDPNERIYKTGDVVRWSEEGDIEYIGRSDFQAQIRGFRVELGEIETVLMQHAAIKESIVIAEGINDIKRLIAYYTQHDNTSTSGDELRQMLEKKLPEYMVPAVFVKLDKMPLSPAGKIDRKALPKSDDLVNDVDNYIAPRNAVETKIAEILSELLNYKKISINDHFFHLGGNSILSIRLLAKIKNEFNCNININHFFQQPTVAGLAAHVLGNANKIDVIALAKEDANYQAIPHKISYPEKITIKNVLLTGANGFLGTHLIDSLLKNPEIEIYALLRGKNIEHAHERLKKAMQDMGLPDTLARVHLIQGDLAKPQLGLSQSQWNFLAENIDSIYHNGALVNHVYDYTLLKAANVNSTIELLKLASEKKPKLFHYISTLNAISQFDAEGNALEQGPGDQPPGELGYILSKWVAEKIVWNAANQGLRVAIYRPGNITGHSKTGMTQFESNHALLLLKSFIQLGVVPDWKSSVEMTPVDMLSDVIVRLSLGLNETRKVYNLANPHMFSWKDYFALLNDLGFNLKVIPAKSWSEDYIQHIDENNALYPLKDMYVGNSILADHGPDFKFESKYSQQSLAEIGMEYMRDYPNQVKIYLDYLIRQGFINK